VPGDNVTPGLAGGWVAVEPARVGPGDGVAVAGTAVADETGPGVADRTGSGVGVCGSCVGPVALVGEGEGGVDEGVTGTGVGVMVGIVWFGDWPSPASPTGAPKTSKRSASTQATANKRGRALICLSFTPHLSKARAGEHRRRPVPRGHGIGWSSPIASSTVPDRAGIITLSTRPLVTVTRLSRQTSRSRTPSGR
jgi:hypothetical protein